VRLHEDYRVAMEAWLQTAMRPVRSALEQLSPQARAHFMEGWRLLQKEAARPGSSQGSGDCAPES